MNSSGNNDDCYFYYYSSCTKGDDCPFRHCKAALGTEIVCVLWREGKCKRNNCKFRHMESRINRKSIQCYWEDQPKGCLKPHCVFFHRKRASNVKTNAGIEELILPVSISSPETAPYDSEVCPVSIPIEPIVFSIDSEESDSESTSSSPIKPTYNDSKCNPASAMKNLNEFSNNDHYGITSLELLKIEKILKEPDDFYKYDYDAPLTDPSYSKMKSQKVELYSRRNMRNRPLNRRNTSAYSEKVVPPMKSVNLKKTKDENLDFKIETLDEIRNKKMTDSSSDNQKKERNRTILREVQNIAADQNKNVNKGKRKYITSNCTDEKNPKQLKMNNSNSSKNILGVRESEEKQVKCSRPTIKRKRSTNSFQTSVSQSKEISSTFENIIQPLAPEKAEKATSKENSKEDSFKRVQHKDKSTPKSLVDDNDSFRLNEVNATLDHKPAASADESDDIVFEIVQRLRELSL